MMKSPKAVRSSYLNCHGATYHAAQNIELVAGSDPYQEQADLFAERWGIDHSHIYNDHREMLEKEFLDIFEGSHKGAARPNSYVVLEKMLRGGERAGPLKILYMLTPNLIN